MEWDLYEDLKKEVKKDARLMQRMLGQYRCNTDPWSEAYDAVKEQAERIERGDDKPYRWRELFPSKEEREEKKKRREIADGIMEGWR